MEKELKFQKGSDTMALVAETVNDLLNTLEDEDYQMAVNYIQFLSYSRKKVKVKKAEEVMDQIQPLIESEKGWESEEDMLADMAAFRKERMGL